MVLWGAVRAVVKTGVVFGAPVAAYRFGQLSIERQHREFTALTAESHAKGTVALYRFPNSPPCEKVKAFLDWHAIPHSTVDVNVLTKEQLYFSADYKLVPVAIVKGRQVNDSSVILESLVGKPLSERDAEALALLDAEVVPAAEMVMFGTQENAALLFEGSTNPVERSVAPYLMPLMARFKIKPKLGDAADPDKFQPALLRLFDKLGEPGTPPSVASLATFGVLRNMRALPECQAALRAAGREEWFASIDAECKANAHRVAA